MTTQRYQRFDYVVPRRGTTLCQVIDYHPNCPQVYCWSACGLIANAEDDWRRATAEEIAAGKAGIPPIPERYL